jgi:hypothetical protein
VATGIGATKRIWRRQWFFRLTGIELQIFVLPGRNPVDVQLEVYQRKKLNCEHKALSSFQGLSECESEAHRNTRM